jgi:hypothetical protein
MGRSAASVIAQETEIRIRGKNANVPFIRVADRTIVVTGKWLKVASAKDEELVEGHILPDPRLFVSTLRESELRPDLLVFPQRIDEATPKYSYPMQWDNAAVIRTSSFNEWWAKLPQETRKNVRRSAKRNVSVRVVKFDDDFVKKIKEIYDESPIRQGRRFWHFGKDLETIKKQNSTYLERSEFIGAYCNEELIGFIKFVYVDRAAKLMQILSKSAHYDKRPMNALIAKAVEVCHERGISYLVYSRLTFGNKKESHLTEFKRRNGFEEMRFPRYYVPLTLKGKIALKLNLHRSVLEILPSRLINLLLRVRSAFLRLGGQQRTKRELPEGVAVQVASQDHTVEP